MDALTHYSLGSTAHHAADRFAETYFSEPRKIKKKNGPEWDRLQFTLDGGRDVYVTNYDNRDHWWIISKM